MLTIITITLLVSFNALYVAAEFATVSARKTRVNQLATDGKLLAKKLLPILNDIKRLDQYVAACQVGITATSLLLGIYGQNVLAKQFTPLLTDLGSLALPTAHSLSITITLIALTFLQMILGELLPKSIAIQYPEQIAMATFIPMNWSIKILMPLIMIFNGSGRILLKLLNLNTKDKNNKVYSLPEIQMLASNSKDAGILTYPSYFMLKNTLRLRNLTASNIMTPREKLIAASDKMSISQLLPMCIQFDISRIPIYDTTIDHITGFLHVKDLLRSHTQKKENIKHIIRQALFIKQDLPVIEIWNTLSSHKQYLSIVVDHNENTVGLITYEDLIEEVFGDLQDEFNLDTIQFTSDSNNRIVLHADMLIAEANEYLNTDLPATKEKTIGELLQSQTTKDLKVGDEVTIHQSKTQMRIEEVRELHITRVSIALSEKTRKMHSK